MFPLILRIDRWWRRKFTPAGGLVLASLVASAAFGVNTREAQVYQLFGLLLALLMVAAAASMRRRSDVDIERRLPECAVVGVPFHYTLTLTNRGRLPCYGLWLQDTLRTEFPQRREWRTAAQPKVNVVDRVMGYRQWIAWVRQRQGARLEPVVVPSLQAGASCDLALECLPRRRGLLVFEGAWAGAGEPLGLLRSLSFQSREGKVLVLPQRYPVRMPILAGTRRLQPGGESFAAHVGDAEEFSGVRDYRPGDSPRRLHWKAWARSGSLVVKEYQEEYFVRQALVLDNFSRDSVRFEAAVSAAASLVAADRPQDSLLDLMFVEGKAYTLTQGRGLNGEEELLRVLAAVTLAAEGDFSILARAVDARVARLSGVICILLAWDGPRRALVAGLRAMGVPVQVWLVDEGDALPDPGPLSDLPQHLRRLRPAHLAQDLTRE